MRPLIVGVVGDQDARRFGVVWVEGLDDLRSLGISGRSVILICGQLTFDPGAAHMSMHFRSAGFETRGLGRTM